MVKATATISRRDYQSEVSARILAELERGALPWVRPWAHSAGRKHPTERCH
jgi:antirestriction protein ArdC